MEDANPWTGKPFSDRYKELKRQRENLPVYLFRKEIMESVANNRVTIIEGSTGSGKTTQIPQFLLEFDKNARIVCTQPRRVAAINVSNRVAQEMDVPIGDVVGYAVRFDSKASDKTRLIYMTEGLLMREFVQDADVSKYDIIIIDEAHERTINTDIIIGLLKGLVNRRDNLHVVIMSATLEASKFTSYFQGAPHLEVPGKLHKIEIVYTDEPVGSYADAAVAKVVDIHYNEGEGDVLLFLTGEEEIEMVCGRIRDRISAIKAQGRSHNFESLVLPLYASLMGSEQQKVFEPTPEGTRKIIVSTNIAETSVTIDGVVYVVDPGYVKLKQYDPTRRMSRLVITPISKAAANQRAGRAGRTRAGKCYRLYTEAAYQMNLNDQTVPEIQRTELSQVVLTMLATGINDIVNFPFLDKPPKRQLLSAVEELYHLQAITMEGKMTDIGQKMTLCPVDPKLARALICAGRYGCVSEMCTLVALLSEAGQLLVRPSKEGAAADRAHEMFRSATGDHLMMLNVYEAYKRQSDERHNMGSRINWCNVNYVSHKFINRMDKNRSHLISLAQRLGLEVTSLKPDCPDRETIILRALLSGLFMQIAMLNQSTNLYMFLQSQREAEIHPSSSVHGNATWIVYSEYVYTKADYLRTVSVIEPEWVFEAAPTYFDEKLFADSYVKRALFTIKKRMERS